MSHTERIHSDHTFVRVEHRHLRCAARGGAKASHSKIRIRHARKGGGVPAIGDSSRGHQS